MKLCTMRRILSSVLPLFSSSRRLASVSSPICRSLSSRITSSLRVFAHRSGSGVGVMRQRSIMRVVVTAEAKSSAPHSMPSASCVMSEATRARARNVSLVGCTPFPNTARCSERGAVALLKSCRLLSSNERTLDSSSRFDRSLFRVAFVHEMREMIECNSSSIPPHSVRVSVPVPPTPP